MHLEPAVELIAIIALTLCFSGFLLKKLGQPYVVGYLLGGVLMGPHGIGVVTDTALLAQFGDLGVVLLLFFVGMEVSPSRLIANWRVAAIGTLLQIGISVACIWLLGTWLEWPLARSVLLGFVVSLSSTAVALRLIQEGRFVSASMGDQVTGMLLAQDVALVPMMLVLGFLGTGLPSAGALAAQGVGTILIVGVVVWVARAKEVHLPLARLFGDEPELQVFAGLLLCFGLGLLTGLLGLSTALGAFVAGLVVTAARETQWIHTSLEPFRVVFVALFFASVGMLLDLNFVAEHWPLVLGLTVAVLATKTVLNTAILRYFGNRWREALPGGAVLAQVGELSYLLAAVGIQAGIVTGFTNQVTVAMITLSLVLSPAWLFVCHRFSTKHSRTGLGVAGGGR